MVNMNQLIRQNQWLSKMLIQIFIIYQIDQNHWPYPFLLTIKILTMTLNSTINHLQDIKKLNVMLQDHQKKLDQKVDQAISHMMSYSYKINDSTLPEIQNKKLIAPQKYDHSFNYPKRSIRTRSVGTRSFLQKSFHDSDLSQADSLLQSYKNKSHHRQNQQSHSIVNKQVSRPIGSQKYAKPKHIKKNPQILPKQIRCNPFSEKNAIKAHELEKGMLYLVETGKIGKNIDIITAFEKGRPVLEAHQAIVHEAQQKYAYAELERNQEKPKKTKNLVPIKDYEKVNYSAQGFNIENENFMIEDSQPNWAITMPENTIAGSSNRNVYKKVTSYYSGEDLQDFHYLEFSHYKVTINNEFKQMKKKKAYFEYWGQIMSFLKVVQKILKSFGIDLIYLNSKKMLNYLIANQSLSKPKFSVIKEFLIHKKSTKTFLNEKIKRKNHPSLFDISQLPNLTIRQQKAVIRIQASFRKYRIRKMFMGILHRNKIEKKIKQWIHNGLVIKEYRKSLIKHYQYIQEKFEEQQKNFKINYPSIQSNKHYQIHIPNKKYMNGFEYMEQISNTEITRIFNLENSNTNLIYISPWEISIQTINYYFKIMELEEIDDYHERVTFLELNSSENKINLPQHLNTSSKLYYNTKVLRKLKKKIATSPAYLVINQPTEIDIRLSVFLGVPIYSGSFNKTRITRSLIASPQFSEGLGTIESTPALGIEPRSMTILTLSNVLMRYCESNRQTNKFVIKINNHHSSSGMALLSYPFTSLPEMYSNTVLVQPYYHRSIERYYIDLIHQGGTIQKYQQGMKTIIVIGKILHDGSHVVSGTFERVSSGFVNIAYIFPQRVFPHKKLMQKCEGVMKKLIDQEHFGDFELTLIVDFKDNITVEEIELYSTKISNSLSYFKFLAGGYFNGLGDFITKITGQQGQDEQIATMQSRTFCYIPFLLHFGLSEKQSTSFFQLCRIGGVSFDLQNKFGSTFILLGSMKNCIGVITSAKQKKSSLKIMSKTLEFLIKQNSHNISNQMLKEKEKRLKDRFNIVAIKQRIDNC